MAPECSHMTTICHFPFWFQWKHLSRLPKRWNFHLVDSKCFQIKFITNKFFFTGRCHFQLSNIRITKRFWLAGDDDYLRGATSINHQVALRANFKMYSRFAKGGEKGDPNRNPWLAKMHQRKVFYKDAQVCPDPLTNMAATGNSCFWLTDFLKSSLKPLGQMNRHLVWSIYGMSSINIAHFVPIR
jgi:hypothetical protein